MKRAIVVGAGPAGAAAACRSGVKSWLHAHVEGM